MEIKVLGIGCSKCKVMESQVRKAIEQMHLDVPLIKVQDYNQIMAYGVMNMPALVLNEKVVISGRIPSVEEIIKIITEMNNR